MADIVGRCSVAGGVVDIGGGLYQRSHSGSTDERWFVTTLADADVCTLATSCPSASRLMRSTWSSDPIVSWAPRRLV